MLDTAMHGDAGTYVEEQLLIMERNGYPEETYYTFSYSPIPNDDGSAGGIICANTDDTQRVIGERQLALLRELAAPHRRGPDLAAGRRARSQALATNRARPALRADLHGRAGQRPPSLVGSSRHRARPCRRCRRRWSLDDVGALAVRRGAARAQAASGSPILHASSATLPTGAWAQPPTQRRRCCRSPRAARPAAPAC